MKVGNMSLNSYSLSRAWFDFCFENPEKINPTHTALYMFAVEHCNRLGWKEKFGLPTEMAKDAIGVKSWHTYMKAFNDIIDFGFFKLIERSKNQYSSNIIALINFDKALDKALDKATTKHVSKQVQSTYQSIDSIIKLLNEEQLNKEQINSLKIILKKYDEPKGIQFEIDENFRLCLEKWFKYKKSSYKNNDTKQACYNHLIKLSKNDHEIAMQIVDQSIANAWKGLFELKEFKNKSNGSEKHKPNFANNEDLFCGVIK